MNCPKCGGALPQGAQLCPTCGEPLLPYSAPGGAGYAGYGAQPAQPFPYPPAQSPGQGFVPTQPTPGVQPFAAQGYGQPASQPAPQPVVPPAQPVNPSAYPTYSGFPQGYRAAANTYQTVREPSPFLAAMAQLPRVLGGLFRDPGETLRGMLERGDVFTGAVAAFLALLLTFVGAMVVARGTVALVFSAVSALTGASLAGDAAGLNQGMNYIAGKIAPALGGVAALCQLAAIVFPAATLMVYACGVRKALRFSLPLLSGCVALTTLPTVLAALLCMLASLISPALSLVVIAIGALASAIVFGALLARTTGRAESECALPKLVCVSLYTLLTLLFILVVGGALTGGVTGRMLSLMSSMSSML